MKIRCNENEYWDDDDKCWKDIPKCANYSDRGVYVRHDCDRDVGKTCDVTCYGGGNMKINCNEAIQWEVEKNFSCVRGRRFAHEVVKAMKDFFFSKINENNAPDLDLIILLDVSRYEWVRTTVDLVKSLLLRSERNQRSKFYSLITYGNEGHVACTVCSNDEVIEELEQVAKKQHQKAGSNLGSGLSRIFTRLLLHDRLNRNRSRILLLVTGQNPGISHNHQLWTKILREDAAFKMFVLSLDDGKLKDEMQDEMKRLADQPWQNHYFHLNYSEIHEAVGNLTNNESGIVNSTGHLVQQMKLSLNPGKAFRMFIYMYVGHSSDTFTLVKQVTMDILQCMIQDQSELEVYLNTNDGVQFITAKASLSKLNGLQLSALQTLTQPVYPMVNLATDNDYLPILLFISSSGRIFENEDINILKDKGFKIYAVGVGEQTKMEDMQDLVSFPWYQHLVHASDGTVDCDG